MATMKRLPALIVLLIATLIPLAGPSQFTIRVGVDLVDVSFTVVDRKGRIISNLSQSDFVVEEEGKRQEIIHFSRESQLPLTLAMLLDVSPSVRPVFREEQETAGAFIASILRPKDLALLISFDKDVLLVQDFTDNPNMLRSRIETLTVAKNGTSLYDAVYLASSEKLAKEVGRKAIILISDGEDTTSKFEIGKALIAAHQSNAIIYSISNAAPKLDYTDRGSEKTLRKLSEETGGSLFVVREPGDFEKIFSQISQELRSQYTLAYHSSNLEQDGKFRRIKISTKDSSLTARARRGYYAGIKAAN
jgi:VWFA-related protein